MILTAVISINTDLLAALLTLFSLSVAHARRIAEVPRLAIFMTFTSIAILFGVFVNLFVEHDEEAESKGNDEKAIPSEEEEECLEDPEEHGDVDVVLLQLRMPTN